MTPPLPPAFLRAPLAHRALHDVKKGRPENSLSAIEAAIQAGYGIEIDVQLTADGQAVVFHDHDLKRLTGQAGTIHERSCAEAQRIALAHGGGETIPSVPQVLQLVAGRVPLLIEIKDQDGGMGPDIGQLEQATARGLAGYDGPVAVMSLNPHSVAKMARLAPDLPRGLVTSAFLPSDWTLPVDTCDRLREIPDFDRCGAAFISHDWRDLARARVQELRGRGVPVLCWTVRSAAVEAKARKLADNVTFEGYAAALPA